MGSHRVAVITGLPAPYREPVFAELARRPGINLKVFYAARGHADVGWSVDQEAPRSYPHVFLRNYMPSAGRRLPMVGYATLGLTRELRTFAPDYLIVYGYNQLSQWLAFAYGWQHNIPFALRSDSNALLDTGTSWRNRLRRRLVGEIVRRAHAVLPVGTANREYWLRHGARGEQIVMAPYAVDNDRIARRVGRRAPARDGRCRLLYIGRLLPRKGVDLLIDAFERVRADVNVDLTIVGDGPDRARLIDRQSSAARAQTRWLGKLTNDQAIERMAQADLFILPSRYEPWGLVINEAMAAGLPVIADERAGGALDLIEPGKTGWTYEHGSVDSLSRTIRQAVGDRDRLAEMGLAARSRIADWTIAATVDGMVGAIESALGSVGRAESTSQGVRHVASVPGS